LEEDQPAPSGLLGGLIRREARVMRAISDEQGRFRFERLVAGDYQLVARPQGEVKKRLGPSAAKRVRIDEDRVTRGVELRLAAAIVLAGVVRDEQSQPVEGASVTLGAEGPTASAERGQSDGQGRFEIGGLSPGRYTAVVGHEGFADTLVKDIVLEKKDARPKDLEVVLQRGVQVVVRVFGPDGRPASGARAEL